MKSKLVAQLREIGTTIADELAQGLEKEQTHALCDKPGFMTVREALSLYVHRGQTASAAGILTHGFEEFAKVMTALDQSGSVGLFAFDDDRGHYSVFVDETGIPVACIWVQRRKRDRSSFCPSGRG